jgi:holliday junction DNA helicase RuvA
MITSIRGTLTESGLVRAVVEVDGFGYEVHVPVTTAERLPAVGSTVRLHTLVIYREDSQTLYGFATAEDRDFFRMMIENVTGIGPKMALSIMSRLSLPLLQGAIRSGDIASLAKVPGIGKKTAERLVVELKGRVGSADAPSPSLSQSGGAHSGRSTHADAVAALAALGYKLADADEAVRRASLALGAEATTEALIRKSLG